MESAKFESVMNVMKLEENKQELITQEFIKEKFTKQEFIRALTELKEARQEIRRLHQILDLARKNLEDEKYKNRTLEQHRNLLENYLIIVRDVIFIKQKIDIEDIEDKEKLNFLKRPILKLRNIYTQNQTVQNNQQSSKNYSTESETDSTEWTSRLNRLADSLNKESVIKYILQEKINLWQTHEPSDMFDSLPVALGKFERFNSWDIISEIKNNLPTASQSKTVVSINEKFNPMLFNTKIDTKHYFISKMLIKPRTCTCGKRARFGKIVLKCRKCSIIICDEKCESTIEHSCIY